MACILLLSVLWDGVPVAQELQDRKAHIQSAPDWEQGWRESTGEAGLVRKEKIWKNYLDNQKVKIIKRKSSELKRNKGRTEGRRKENWTVLLAAVFLATLRLCLAESLSTPATWQLPTLLLHCKGGVLALKCPQRQDEKGHLQFLHKAFT